jgi:hypothetical protein
MLVIGVSGRKQSGKSTLGRFVLSLSLAQLDYCNNIYMDEETGEILVSDILGDDRFKGVFDIREYKEKFNDPRLDQAIEKLNRKIKIYNFADVLKTDICMNILGLTYDQCYGSDDNKNELTDMRWDGKQITAREVMQIIGTDIFRKMDTNVWVRATINKIINDKPEIAVITDCRFPNEVESIKNIGGKVIRLTRNPFNSDHISECVLDEDRYDWSNFDYVLDNKNSSVYEQFVQSKKLIEEILTTTK